MNIKPFAAVLFAGFVTACQTSDLGDPDACGAVALQSLVGQNKNVLQTMTFAGPVWVLNPNDMMTMDFNPHRLNIISDAVGIIDVVRCG